MLRVYRIANPLYIYDRSGEGARLRGGRWNDVGTPMLYTASSIALAAWEVRVHLPNNIIPRDDAFALGFFSIPGTSIFQVNDLPDDWKSNIVYTRGLGENWIKDCKYLCMKVPSSIVAHEFNYLINPGHPLATELVMEQVVPFVFDSRTFVV